MTFAIETPSLPEPSAFPVEWEVRMPPLEIAEAIEPSKLIIREHGAPILSRRIPRVVRVHHQTWFGARARACLFWSRHGVHFNPMSIR